MSSSKHTVASLKNEIDELRQLIQSLTNEISGLKMTLNNESSTSSSTAAPAKATKVTKEKKERDPNAPKKITGYIQFCNEKRADIKAANPDMKTTEIVSELGRQWKALSDDEKARYESNAKAAYEAAKTEYDNTKTA